MDNENHKCPKCGSMRLVSGKVCLAHGFGPDFEFSEVKKLRWLRHDTGRHGVGIREPFSSAKVCLDCETGSVSFTIDAKKAIAVLEKWGTDELKARLTIGDKSGSDETKV
jgi:hypothetical protein